MDHPLALPIPTATPQTTDSNTTSGSQEQNDATKSPELGSASGKIGVTPSISSLEESMFQKKKKFFVSVVFVLIFSTDLALLKVSCIYIYQ